MRQARGKNGNKKNTDKAAFRQRRDGQEDA